LAPAVILLAAYRLSSAIALCIAIEVFTDILDGIIARRIGVETERLRRADSFVDTVFFVSVAVAFWMLFPDLFRRYFSLLAVLIALEALRYAYDWLKFRRAASYHMYSAKAWGLVLGAAMVALFGFGYAGWLLPLAIVIGILSDIEGLLISFLLTTQKTDVHSVFAALELRRSDISLPTT
jgi:CDP-diacylglycerol--glycerol-3-phosphate 3-phosphatidyltransferase